jgi:hypothetical protein
MLAGKTQGRHHASYCIYFQAATILPHAEAHATLRLRPCAPVRGRTTRNTVPVEELR